MLQKWTRRGLAAPAQFPAQPALHPGASNAAFRWNCPPGQLAPASLGRLRRLFHTPAPFED